jgi:hypothetical protein
MLQDLVSYRALLAGLALALTAFLAGDGLYLLARSRHRIDPAAPLLDSMLRRPAAARTLIEQRHRALMHRGNLWEPARAVLRRSFEAAGLPAAGTGKPAAPRVDIKGSWWQRRRLERLVRRLWQTAYGERPVPVSPREFTRLATDLDTMQEALATGTLRLQFPESPVPRRPAPMVGRRQQTQQPPTEGERN